MIMIKKEETFFLSNSTHGAAATSARVPRAGVVCHYATRAQVVPYTNVCFIILQQRMRKKAGKLKIKSLN